MRKSLGDKILFTMLFLTMVYAASLLPFIHNAAAWNLSPAHKSPLIQYEEEIGPPPVPDTPRAPEPGEMYDPALSSDSAISEPDPLFEEPEPVVEQPEPYVEEAEPFPGEAEPEVEEPEPLVDQPEPLVPEEEPLVDEPESMVPQGEPLGDREAEGRGIR
ncbi:MAG: hypothetical protein RIG61_01320 [Deltaproteobacteria bacterium]